MEDGTDMAKLSESYVFCMFGTVGYIQHPGLTLCLTAQPLFGDLHSKYLASSLPQITTLGPGARL